MSVTYRTILSMKKLNLNVKLVILIITGFPLLGLAQETKFTPQIVLDKGVKAGDLTCFPEVGNNNRYYYLPNQPKIAMHEDGTTPVFSFIRFVQNERSAADAAEIKEAGGGGIVHVMFGLSVSPEQRKAAEQELRRIVPSATLIGPVIYQSGTCSLVTSPPGEGEKKQVVGVGPAPVMDGDFVAVSILLSKKESQLLWATFQTPTPDLSFTFNMMLGGYNSPVTAKVTFNRDQIYKHKNFQMGVATPVFGAEIGIMVQELKDNGAIKIEQVGSDVQMERLLELVQQKFTEEFCAPMGSANAPNFSQLGAIAGGERSFLDRATDQYNKNVTETRAANDAIRRENSSEQEKARAAARADRADERAERERDREGAATGTTPPTGGGTTDSTAAAPPKSRKITEGTAARSATPSDKPTTTVPPYVPQLQKQQSAPLFYAMASFQMKEIRTSGTKTFDFSKSLATSINQTFSKNIGKLDCKACFKEVNLDDPLYKQREIVAMVDGMNATDFGQYVNFVTLSLQKKHQSGELTNDEVRIDRKNFNKEGNNFKLLYGWKGDADRNKWMDYKYKTSWSFFGGYAVNEDWKDGDAGAISLTPPFQRKLVDLQGDAQALKDKEVRLVNVTIFYKIGDQEQSIQTSLNPANESFAKRLDFILPKGINDYEYEITWVKKGNTTQTSGRKKYNGTTLFVDEI